MTGIFVVKYNGDKDYGQAQGWVVRAVNAIEAKSLVYASLADYRRAEYSDEISDWDVVRIPVNGESVILLTNHSPG